MAPYTDADQRVSPKAELLHLLLEATNDGVMDWNITASSISYSERWKMLLGFEAHELIDTPSLWRELSHPEDLPAVDAHLRDHLEDHWPFYLSWRMRHKNGGWRWLLCRAGTVRDDADRPARWVGVFTDVTDPMQVQERNQALATALPDVLIWIDARGGVLDIRPGREESPACFQGLRAGDALDPRLPPDTLAKILAGANQAITSRCVVASEGESPDGERFEMRIVGSGDEEALLVIRPLGLQTATRSADAVAVTTDPAGGPR